MQFFQMRSKGVVSSFCEVNTVEGQFDVPVEGVGKGDIETLRKEFIFFCYDAFERASD